MTSWSYCPCENCRYYEANKQHPNPNAVDPDCKKIKWAQAKDAK